MIAQLHTRVGNPETEPEFLAERSPLFRAGDITIPLLIGQGGNDPKVTPAESDQIVKALSEKGMAPDYLYFQDEGHGLVNPANRLRFYRAVELFLATHLGGRCAPVPETV